jgi:hypothetical protein
VLWLMGQAGYIGRDVAGLGAEPPVETVAEDEEPVDASDGPPPATSLSPPILPPAAPATAPPTP